MSCISVSVIIPNYNHAAYLEQRLISVAMQDYHNLNGYVLDDCSDDNSRNIIEEFLKKEPRFTSNFNETNSGSTFSQWNKGLSLAQDEFVWIAESDDLADVTMLSNLVHVMESDSSIVLAYCQSLRMNAAGNVTGSWMDFTDTLDKIQFNSDFVMDGREFIKRFLIHRNVIPNASAVLFRKSIFEMAGGAASHLRTNGDWLMWLKMLCFGKVAYVSAPLNYFRMHDKSVIAKTHQLQEIVFYKEKYDFTMRHEFLSFIENWEIDIPFKLLQKNALYMSMDLGNKGLFSIKKGDYLKGWKDVLCASFYPKFQSGFIKKGLGFT